MASFFTCFVIIFNWILYPDISYSSTNNHLIQFRLIVSSNYLNSINVADGVIIVGVRNKEAYQIDHITNAQNIPVGSTLDKKIDRVASLHVIQYLIQQAGITENDWVILI